MSDYPDNGTDASRPRPADDKTQKATGSRDGGTDLGTGEAEGEDEGSAPHDGQDAHVKEDQKPTSK